MLKNQAVCRPVGTINKKRKITMSGKRISTKYKIDRRLGCNLWGRMKSPYNLRQTAPGMHGERRGKLSDYGLQLMAKQKLKGYYGNVGEKQFRTYFKEASRLRGDAGQNLIGLLERRLDAVVYRAKFVPTVFSSRQFVNHGHVTVNGKYMNIPSYQVKDGDVIEVKESSRTMALVLEAQKSTEREYCEYIEVDEKSFKATFLRAPSLEDVPYASMMEPNLIVEFYSR
jgi:small subunit ribosomal protein S4